MALGVALKILAERFEDIGTEADKVRITAFADDVTFVAHKRSKIKEALKYFVALTEPLGLKINVDKTTFTAYFSGPEFNVDTSDICIRLEDGREMNIHHSNKSLLLGYGLCYQTGICLADHMITREVEKKHTQQLKDYKKLR